MAVQQKGNRRGSRGRQAEPSGQRRPGWDPLRTKAMETETEDQPGDPSDVEEPSGWRGPSPEDLLDEEDPTPELLGDEDQRGYDADPDGDPTDTPASSNPLDARVAEGEGGLPHMLPMADIIVEAEGTQGRRIFHPYSVSRVAWHHRGRKRSGPRVAVSQQAERLMNYLRERQQRLIQIAEVILERQRPYFESLFEGTDPYEAFLTLRSLTHVEVGKRLQLDHEVVGGLATSSYIEAAVVGSVPAPTSIFFGDQGPLGVRTDVLAAHIRGLIAEQPALTVNEIRKALECKRLIPCSRDNKEKISTNERIRQVMEASGLERQGRRKREGAS